MQIHGSGTEIKESFKRFEAKRDYEKYTIPKTYLIVLSCALSSDSTL